MVDRSCFRRVMRRASVSILLPSLGFTTVANSADEAPALQEVVVTGTRIVRDNFTSPTPVTVMSVDDLKDAAPQSTFAALKDLPQFFGSAGAQGFVGLQTGSAASRLNLRNLGSGRLLVLVDGRRHPPSNSSGEVDTNLIPDALISRVDIVTGGASAAYGSDAVAGALNYVLDTKFEGLKGEVSYGTSRYGDADSRKVSSAFGTSFASGRGHVIASADYFQQDPILSDNTNRQWRERGKAQLVNAPGAFPTRYNVIGAVSTIPTGGLITAGPLVGNTFDASGNPVPYAYGSPRDPNNMVGGGGNRNFTSLSADQERYNLFSHARFDVSDSLSVFLEAAHGEDEVYNTAQQLFTLGANYLTISRDNPYLTPQTQAMMDGAGVSSFKLERLWGDVPATAATGTHKLTRFATGIDGEFRPDWKYSGYVQYSESKEIGKQGGTQRGEGALHWRSLYAAVDAVRDPVSGEIVCRSLAQNPGCVPINVLGPGNITQAAYDYVQGVPNMRTGTLEEWSAGLSTQLPLFSLWSEPVVAAVGYEYRELGFRQVGTSDGTAVPDFTGIGGVPPGRLGQPGQFMTGGFPSYAGTTTVNEGFLELDVPVIRDRPGVFDLSTNAAIRYTEYDPSGPATTWKVGVNYQPVNQIRLRATYSEDIHAPSPQQLYDARRLTTIGTIVHPLTGQVLPAQGFVVGNIDLVPEEGTTYTAGIVYQPAWLDGFSISADYWNISIAGAIQSVGSIQSVVDDCYLKSAQFACSLFTEGAILSADLPLVNLSELDTSGFDLEATYSLLLGPGSLGLRATWSYLDTYATALPGAKSTDTAEQLGRWSGRIGASYSIDRFDVSATARFLDTRTVNVLYLEGRDIEDNTDGSSWWINLNAKYAFGDAGRYEAFLNVQNLLDRSPTNVRPGSYIQIHSSIGFGGTAWEDPIGRYYTAGVRFKF